MKKTEANNSPLVREYFAKDTSLSRKEEIFEQLLKDRQGLFEKVVKDAIEKDPSLSAFHEDLISVAKGGFYMAILNYNPNNSKRASLDTYARCKYKKVIGEATRSIKGISKHYFEENQKVLGYLRENGKSISKVCKEDIPDIAKGCDCSEKTVMGCIIDCTTHLTPIEVRNSDGEEIGFAPDISGNYFENDGDKAFFIEDINEVMDKCLTKTERIFLRVNNGYYDFGKMSVVQMAEAFDMDYKAVQKTLSKAKKKLRNHLEERGYGNVA